MAGLRCPHCGAYTASNPLAFRGDGIDPTGGFPPRKITAWVQATTEGITSLPHFAILECMSCRKHFVACKKASNAEWDVVYPLPIRAAPDNLPPGVARAFREAALCFAVEAYGGCLLMARTALIRLQREQKVSKLQELSDQGKISNSLYRQADEVRLWANLVGHEDVPDVVEKEDCEELLAYLEELLHAIYTAPAKLNRLTEKRKTSTEKPGETASN